jgi:cysteine desulfurase
MYFDHAASAPVNPKVLVRFNQIAETLYGNPSSVHNAGLKAEACIKDTKKIISEKFNCLPDEIYFTSGATMSNNLLIQGVMRKHPETMFITSIVEHDDIMLLYNWLPYSKRLVQVDKYGIVDMQEVWQQSYNCHEDGKPCLISIQMANSETGVMQPIKELSKIAHENGAFLHVDATQYIPYYPIDVDELGIDALSMSGQKIGGLKGSGLLYARQTLRENMGSIIFGEQGLIGGTPSTPMIGSLGTAFQLLDYNNESLEQKRDMLLDALLELGGVLVGTRENRLPNNIYIRFPGVNGLTLLNLLNDCDIYIGTGSACSSDSDRASHVALAYGLSEEEAFECVRFTLGNENTDDEIKYVIQVITGLLDLLR